jgi:hypothetical protein
VLRSVLAGIAYFGIVFALGFLLGAFREIYVVDHLGPVVSRLTEVPLMLMLSWFTARWLIRRFAVPAIARERLAMGGTAFALLLLAEAVLSVHGFGKTWTGYLAEYATPDGAVGLAAQAVFGLFPFLMMRRAELT